MTINELKFLTRYNKKTKPICYVQTFNPAMEIKFM